MTDGFDLRDEDVVLELVLRVRRSGAMSVAGCIEDEVNALIMLDSARETIRSHNARKKINAGQSLILPPENSLR
jgi:hypothetical protein